MAESMNVADIEWLYPDLLSEEGLRFILRQRFIQHVKRDLDTLQKEDLVELYNRYVLPLPQRKYRSNRRGQEMTRKQILLDKSVKRKSTDESSEIKTKKERTQAPSGGLTNHCNSSTGTGTRLKPPPSLVNSENKVVKLTSTRQSPSSLNFNCQAVDQVLQSSKNDGPSPAKKQFEKITWP